MKTKLLAGLAMGLFVIGISGVAHATIIIDTGTKGPDTGISWSLGSYQWLAAEFTLSDNYTISDLEAFLWGHFNATATAAIYADGGDLPGLELYSQQFSVPAANQGWYGASGLGWALSAGTYWASFEVRPGDTYSGSLPGSALVPLANEAYTSDGNWQGFDDLCLAIRISGDRIGNQVPEPSTMLLLGTGLLGLVGLNRRKKK